VNGRKIRPGYESFVPRTSEDLASRFKVSDISRQNRKMVEMRYEQFIGNHKYKQTYLSNMATERTPKSTAYMNSIPQQVKAVMKRRLQVIVGNKFELFVQVA
jgi:ATP-binding cassette subfamily G (WHITE) protein 2 (SNQ2)